MMTSDAQSPGMPPERKLSLPVLFYVISLTIITVTVLGFLLESRSLNNWVIDLVKQKNSIATFQALVAKTNKDIVELIYFNRDDAEQRINSSTEDFQFALADFTGVAQKYDFITDLSLLTETDSVFEEMRLLSHQIVRNNYLGNKDEAVRLFKDEYIRYADFVTRFSTESLYGKIQIIDGTLDKISKIRWYFVIVFLVEILVTLIVTYRIHRRVSDNLHESNTRLNHFATHDDLTGLYNRRMLINYLDHAVAMAKRHKTLFGVLFFDLDGFKKINDFLGHEAGDDLLRQVTARISCIIRESDTFARIGGDEFVLLVEDVGSADQLADIAEKIIRTFSDGYSIDDTPINISASIGISVYSDDESSAETMLKHADTAMYNAKKSGTNCFRFYSEDLNIENQAQVSMETDIQRALDNNEFSVFYQPKIDPATGDIYGAEALIRWIHPKKGFIPPADFISIAEKSELILDIDAWVRKTVCKQLAQWQRDEFYPLTISVNVSPKEFMVREVHKSLMGLISEYDIKSDQLELEITEGTLIDFGSGNRTDWDVIRNMGVGLSIDDFGMGYCSLNYLKQFPVGVLKIDKSFIDNCTSNDRDSIIISTIIAMGRSMGMTVIAEGVETESQKDFLLEQGCDLIQGYYYSRPLPVGEFETFVEFIKTSLKK